MKIIDNHAFQYRYHQMSNVFFHLLCHFLCFGNFSCILKDCAYSLLRRFPISFTLFLKFYFLPENFCNSFELVLTGFLCYFHKIILLLFCHSLNDNDFVHILLIVMYFVYKTCFCYSF